jgi:hypothetical protein
MYLRNSTPNATTVSTNADQHANRHTDRKEGNEIKVISIKFI